MPSPTPNKALVYPANGGDVNTWDTPVNFDWNTIDTAFGGLSQLNVTAQSGVVTLTATEYVPPIIEITGTLTANVIYAIPSGVGGFWFVVNGATGAFSITFESLTGGGSTLVVKQGITTPMLCDGTNVALQTTLPATAGGANTEVQYNSGGGLAGAAGITTDGSSLSLTGNVIVAGNLILSGVATDPLVVEAAAYTPSAAVAFSATAMALNCALSNVFTTLFTGNVTAAPAISNAQDGQTINWRITQDATGGRTMTWPVAFKWPGGVAGVLSTAPNAVDLVVATYFASTGNWLASLVKGFA